MKDDLLGCFQVAITVIAVFLDKVKGLTRKW